MTMIRVDLEIAFDRADRELLWQVLERYGDRGEAMSDKVKCMYEYRGNIEIGLVSRWE